MLFMQAFSEKLCCHLAESDAIAAKSKGKKAVWQFLIIAHIRQTIRGTCKSTGPAEFRLKRNMWKELLNIFYQLLCFLCNKPIPAGRIEKIFIPTPADNALICSCAYI